METESLKDALIAYLMPLGLIAACLLLAWYFREALRTGRSHSKGGVAVRAEEPVMYWLNMTLHAVFVVSLFCGAVVILMDAMPLPRFLVLTGLLVLCTWQAWPYLVTNFWGRMPGDFVSKAGGAAVLHPLGSVVLASLIVFAIFRAASYL